MTEKTDNEISNLFNYDKLKELCTEKGCHMPEDALSKIADTPTFVRVYFKKIGEIQERGKHEKEVNEMKLCFKNGMSEFCPKRDCGNSVCPLNLEERK